MDITTASRAPRRGGRGARERILQAAAELFHRRGIHATGIAALTEAAHVSTRTFYQHFPTKNALVEAYLHRYETDTPMPGEQQLDRGDLAPAERLLAIFGPLESDPAPVVRGCPFHNAAVEAAGDIPGVADLVARHKRAFRDRLADVAAQAGAADPHALGAQLAVLFEGATALSASCNDTQVAGDARRAAATLIRAALLPQAMTQTAAQQPAQPPPGLVTVADVMRPALTTANTNDHVAAAAYLMKHASVTALMVLDTQTGQPEGILTEADVAGAVADGKDPNDLRIGELMTTRPAVVHPATSVSDAAQIMTRGHFRHLPVSGDSGLAGIIDITDICRALIDPDLSRRPAADAAAGPDGLTRAPD